MKQIEVQIMGQGYVLSCPEEGEVRLRQAAAKVDEAMCSIRDAGKIRARDRIAVLAALNLAFDLTAPAAAPSPEPVAATPSDAVTPAALTAAESARVQQLIDRLDRVLATDGQLL